SVEQQINTNTNLQSLISLQQTSEATSALQLVGSTVTVGGSSAALSNATSTPAQWALTSSSPATANVTVTSSAGTTVYSGTVSLNAGTQSFTWSGQGNNGQTWPDGTYKLDRRQRAGGERLDAGQGRRQRRQSQLESADAHGQWPKRPDQPGHFDHPL